MISASQCFAPQFLAVPGPSPARLRAATFEADGQARGVCVLLNGQTEFIEKYFEVIDELRSRGFAVATMDWRGQGGSSRALSDPRKGYVGDFAEYDRDLESLMQAVVAPLAARVGGTLIGVAHSMGGHILLRALHHHSKIFSACVFSAPMIGISTRGEPRWLVPLASAVMNALGRSKDFVWGMDKRDPANMAFSEQLVTSDPARFARTQALLRADTALMLAGATWGWLGAAYRSLDEINAADYAPAITTPVLICGAGKDRICVTDATVSFARRMPAARYLEIADSEHEILMERDSIREQFWGAFDDFLAKKEPHRNA